MSKKLRATNRQLRRRCERESAHHQFVFGKIITENHGLWKLITQLRGSLRSYLLCMVRPWI